MSKEEYDARVMGVLQKQISQLDAQIKASTPYNINALGAGGGTAAAEIAKRDELQKKLGEAKKEAGVQGAAAQGADALNWLGEFLKNALALFTSLQGCSAPVKNENVSEDDILDLPSTTPSPSPGLSPWMQTPGKTTPGVEMTPTPGPTPTLAPEKLQKYTDPEYCKGQVENDPELRWLVSTVLGEAATIIKSQWEKGEELTAATAIANTIMNRKASDFGDFAPYYSIERITDQWYSGRDERPATEFRAYAIDDMDGFKSISGHDDRYIEITSTPFYNAVMEAVLPVYYGEVDDITKGAVYIYSPQKQIADGREIPSWATRENRASVPGLRGYDLELYYQDGFIGRVPMN